MSGNDLNEAEQNLLLSRETQNNKEKSGILVADLLAVGGRMTKSFNRVGLVSAEIPLSKIRQLTGRDEVAHISADREVQGLGHVGSTAGIYNTGISDRGDGAPNTWLVGSGSGVAVIDSGVFAGHDLFKWWNDLCKVTSFDFTGTGNASDQYGHGTHVASIMSADYRLGNAAYKGNAAGVSVYSLKALNSIGIGSSTNVIAAIDWAITNKSAKNIRVINMSLGTVAVDSYRNDPLCLAARRAVNAGIVVVASAGNRGTGNSDRGRGIWK